MHNKNLPPDKHNNNDKEFVKAGNCIQTFVFLLILIILLFLVINI